MTTATDAGDRAPDGSRPRRRGGAGMAGRVFLGTAAIILAVLVLALAVASRAGRRAAKDAERRGLEQAADLTAQLLAGRGRSLAGGARVFVQGPYFRALVAQRRRDDILDQAFEAARQLGADWVFITDERGTLLAKSDEPGADGAPLGGIPLVAGALQGRTVTGFGASRDTMLFQAVSVPIVVPDAAPVGVLVATKLLDRQMALDVRAATGADVVFYALDAAGKPRAVATSLEQPALAGALLPPGDSAHRGARAARDVQVGDTPYAVHGATVTTAGGEIVGGFVVGRPEDAAPAQLTGMRRSLVVAGLLGLVLALGAAWSAARRVTRPARGLADAAALALDGDYDGAARLAAAATRGRPTGEIATLGAALAAFLGELREKQALGAILARSEAPAPNDDDDERDPGGRRALPIGGRARSAPRIRSAPLARPYSARAPVRPAGALPAGTLVAERYEVGEVLGLGGTGIVYRAIDTTLGENLAIKMLRPELVADDPRAREELKHELRLTRRISHRNVVRTHDFGTSRGVPFITMEFVEGTSLAAILARRGALAPDVVIALGRQLARALTAAHEQGIIHGDLKPANILVAADGLLKVSDFGVAALVRRPRESSTPPRLAGAVIGTPEYMAPERLLGAAPDARADIYAAGMVLHECLTGQTPFQGHTPRGFFAEKLDAPERTAEARESPSRPRSAEQATAATLTDLITSMTARDPAERPASAAKVGAILAQLS